MSIIRFLHISDLHFNKVGFETITMREKLPSYIESLKNGVPIKYIFFTGDLRYAPQIDYPSDAIKYFDDLRKAANVKKENLYVVLGNHDVVRENAERLSAINKLEETYIDKDRVIDTQIINGLKNGRENYYNLLKGIVSNKQYSYHSDPDCLHFVIKTKDINIVFVDSTISYRENKEHELIVGAYNLKKELSTCDLSKPTIILSHYALDTLESSEQKAILRTLKDYHIQLWLAGHKHNEIIRKELDYIYTAQSGNQTFEKGTSPGFVECILDTSLGCGYFNVHKWNASAGWAQYQTLVDYTDKKHDKNSLDKTKYEFVLDDWRNANDIIAGYNTELSKKLFSYLMNYKGNSFFVENLLAEFEVTNTVLSQSLNELEKTGFIKAINHKKGHWEINKKTYIQ